MCTSHIKGHWDPHSILSVFVSNHLDRKVQTSGFRNIISYGFNRPQAPLPHTHTIYSSHTILLLLYSLFQLPWCNGWCVHYALQIVLEDTA